MAMTMIQDFSPGDWRRSLLIVAAMALFLNGSVVALDLSMDSPLSSTPTISKGDPVYIRGTATGQPAGGLQVWLIGNNYAMVDTVPVDADDTYSYELKSSVTANLAQGQYFVLVQHPMMNGEFDVAYDAARGEVTTAPGGMTLFRLTGSGRLQASDAASALVGGVGSQNIDDSFSAVSFMVSPPATAIDPIGDHIVGDTFSITGSTNLAPGNALMVGVISSSFKPTTKMQSGEFTGASGTVLVQKGTGYNRWSFPVDTAGWKPDEYIVTVSAVLQDVTASTTFVLREYEPVTAPVTTPATSVATTPAATTVAAPATTPTAGPGASGVIAGILAILIFGCSRRNL